MENRPLADRMRPTTLEELVGQSALVGAGKILRKAIETGVIPSMIFWGPPGSGKTTLAHIIARSTNAHFSQLSATASGVKDIRAVLEEATARKTTGEKTILFIDEIHRFNKSQQDTFLPYVENGTIILIGATTENPSFEVNAALLSRCRVFVLEALTTEDIAAIIKIALADRARGLGEVKIKISDEVINFLSNVSNGDARYALNALELAILTASKTKSGEITISELIVKEALQKTHLHYDKDGEQHYNIISALHKSMRGGDADAALYWLGRMLEAGEDPLYIARRLVRFASEDIGIANSLALPQAVAAYQACHFIGMPECNVILSQAVVYMAKSKKSNALYIAYGKVKEDIQNLPNEPVPLHLRNAPTKLMKNLGYGKDYKYTPDFVRSPASSSADEFGRGSPDDAAQDYLPERLKGRKYLDF